MARGTSKKDLAAQQAAEAVGAGRPVAVETVDFADPNRPKTCLEVDFPILPVNQVAAIEGNAGKPIYQMSKWWARRRSSVFRSLLLAAAMKAPEDPTQAAKAVWDVYYANHQKKRALAHLKVADVFMGGGTTIVEGSRLGMQMLGVDLNPVAWFVVKTELAQVEPAEVQALLAAIEAEVKPRIMPFYACDCPRGHQGKWIHRSTGEAMGPEFEPLAVPPDERASYAYEGPELIYVFWAKHGPCQVTGCGHRTPLFSSPVMAVKTLTVKAWEYRCDACAGEFDVEEREARMAPGVPLVVAEGEKPYVIRGGPGESGGVLCPFCNHRVVVDVPASFKKKVELTLLVHPQWLRGSPGRDADGEEFGGSATDTPEATAAWNRERAGKMRLLEVRGKLPERVTCPETGETFEAEKGTIPRRSEFACGACGAPQDVLGAIKPTGKTGPLAAYAIQGYCPACDAAGVPYGGRFFAPAADSAAVDAAVREWGSRRDDELAAFWPRSELPFGFMTTMNNGGLSNHGYTHWWTMFNPRQLLVHTQLLRAIVGTGPERFDWPVREFVLASFQQYLRNQNMFGIWDIGYDKLAPALSNANFHPKATTIENSVFGALGRGNWVACSDSLRETLVWGREPWELLSTGRELKGDGDSQAGGAARSQKLHLGDPVMSSGALACSSATDLATTPTGSLDLVITDPPFGGLLHYSELSDFFHVWLRLVLKDRYPAEFGPEYTPKVLEVVANRARQPDDPDAFYQRLLTECWKESHRILKDGGILAFTFHHSEDEPWIAVLESLFEAGFYLEATYPIRSDETKGEGAKPGTFGSQKIEYDIIHVCRKRMQEPSRVSWGRMRREVLQEIRQMQRLLEFHLQQGLPAADLQVIRRGKALEYFSRHYGAVYVDEGRAVTVREALLGVNQLLDEASGRVQEPPPATAEPFTRQFLRIFDRTAEQPRDQMQKFLRGTGIAPSEFEERGWCQETKKIFHLVPPLEFARAWQGRPRTKLAGDLDQALFLIGSCFDGSGINATDTLRNENFRPHPALAALLEWHRDRAADLAVRHASARALAILKSWEASHQKEAEQLRLFYGE